MEFDLREAGMTDFPVDGHVHFHRVEMVGPTLDAAAANFARVTGRDNGLVGAILLVQSGRERVFECLLQAGTLGGGRFSAVDAEPQTFLAFNGQRRIAVVCGQQIRCERGLEVLALGTATRYAEGHSLEETVGHVRQDGALTALPWGFGKWMGKRKKLVQTALREFSPLAVFMGDNGGRIQWLGLPGLLREASDAGFRLLPGTDPFPFGGDYRRVGRFGFLAGLEPSVDHPWTDLRGWLEARPASPPTYGRALDPVRFVRNQIGIQIHHRMMKRATG